MKFLRNQTNTLTAISRPDGLCLTFSTMPYAPRPNSHIVSKLLASISIVSPPQVIEVLMSKFSGVGIGCGADSTGSNIFGGRLGLPFIQRNH